MICLDMGRDCGPEEWQTDRWTCLGHQMGQDCDLESKLHCIVRKAQICWVWILETGVHLTLLVYTPA